MVIDINRFALIPPSANPEITRGPLYYSVIPKSELSFFSPFIELLTSSIHFIFCALPNSGKEGKKERRLVSINCVTTTTSTTSIVGIYVHAKKLN